MKKLINKIRHIIPIEVYAIGGITYLILFYLVFMNGLYHSVIDVKTFISYLFN